MKKLFAASLLTIITVLPAARTSAQSETSFIWRNSSFIPRMPLSPQVSRERLAIKAGNLENQNRQAIAQFLRLYGDKDIRDEQWSHQGNGLLASFRLNGIEHLASFNSQGAWIFTISYLDENALPARIRQMIRAAFSGYRISGIEAIESPSLKILRAHIQNEYSAKVIRILDERLDIEEDFVKTN